MKIALIRKEYDELRGGAERYSVNLARGLAAAGHEVHVFAGSWQAEENRGITMHRVPYIKRPSPVKNISFQRNSRWLVAGESFDIVHGLSQVFPGDVYRTAEPLHAHALQSSGSLKKWLHRLSFRHRALREIERGIFAPGNYRRFIAISVLCRMQLMQYYGIPEEKIRIIYNGVDLEFFNTADHARLRNDARARFNIPDADAVLLFAGNDFKRKGLQLALQYAAALKGRGLRVKLLVAGRGNAAPFLRTARKLRLSDILLFAGSLPDMRQAYHCADLLVHPALYEPFGNVCLEAMACGLPVVTTRLTGAADIIEDGVNGIVTDTPWEIENIAARISQLTGGQEMLQTMGERAAAKAREFTISRNVQETLAVYREILAEKEAADGRQCS